MPNTDDNPQPRTLQRIIRLKDSKEFTGFEPSYVPKLIEEGVLPPLRNLSGTGRASGWFESDLLGHQERIAAQPPVVVRDGQIVPPERRRIERVKLSPEAQERLRRKLAAANG